MWVSDPYIETGVALFASNGSTTVPESVQASSIAAQSSSTSAWAVQNAFGDAAHARRPAGFDKTRAHQRCNPIIKLAQGIAVRKSLRVQLRLQMINRIAARLEFRGNDMIHLICCHRKGY